MSKFYGLIILDGFGIDKESSRNAISIAGTPYIKSLIKNYPVTEIGASGLDVGLPDGQMGNSEVGHLNIGAGRIVYQELTRITKSISDGDFFTNSAFLGAIKNAKENGKKVHLMGLLSDGGVHSHIEHLFALIKLCKEQGVEAYVHCFLDGRDVPPTSGKDFVKQLYDYTKEIGHGKIASVCGRFYAMDRDNRWERVVRAYDMLTLGEGKLATCPVKAVEESYKAGVTDEFVEPIVVVDGEKPVATVDKGDSIIFFNFRPDRARELTRAFTVEEFDGFERKTGYLGLTYVSMTRYDATFNNLTIAYPPTSLSNTLGEYLAKLGKNQLRIAETEKYAHVTFFFNGGVETPNKNEDRILVPSPKVLTYDLKPEMSAYEVAEKAVEAIKSGKYDVMILNFANCDMVGHTGVLDAAVKAVKAVDECVKQVVETIKSVGGEVIITADHGNADKMLEDDMVEPFTAHTTNPVPFIVVSDRVKELKAGGKLADVAPTLLDLMGEEKPSEMTGESLIK
ncbi:MAG: 2,3-bisphosphoglycerate-independent phosphoglycerate mutase [Eubacteriales bacterium]|nr:2,3-bisphosphoglycerate-independent phosphoglycerate mutase [Eubacteriales bacterium]